MDAQKRRAFIELSGRKSSQELTPEDGRLYSIKADPGHQLTAAEKDVLTRLAGDRDLDFDIAREFPHKRQETEERPERTEATRAARIPRFRGTRKHVAFIIYSQPNASNQQIITELSQLNPAPLDLQSLKDNPQAAEDMFRAVRARMRKAGFDCSPPGRQEANARYS